MNKIVLKKDIYLNSRMSVLKSSFLGKDFLDKIKNDTFEEILIKLDKTPIKEFITFSENNDENFYMVEKMINKYFCKIYDKIIINNNNYKLYKKLNFFYIIKNFLTFVKLKQSSKKEPITGFLLGRKKDNSVFVEANEMENKEESIIFVAKRFNLDSKIIIEKYKLGLFELENYLYKLSYDEIINFDIVYNKKDELVFKKYLTNEIDIINLRMLFLLIDKSKNDRLGFFENHFLKKGKIKKEVFLNIIDKKDTQFLDEILKLSNKISHIKIKNLNELDKLILSNEDYLIEKLKISFSSPFYSLRFLFLFRRNLDNLKKILKAKLLKIEVEL